MQYPTGLHQKFFSAILLLKDESETRDFLRDLMTIGELDTLSERWHIARLLWTTSLSYKKIAKKTSASTTTVTRVAHWLDHGMGGYQAVLTRLFGKRA